MEPGNFTTNTILINAITSIPYTYLEPIPPKPTSSLVLLRRIEASWREKGALVICDPSSFGLWVFGSGNEDDPFAKLSSSCVIDKDGGVETHGLKFNAETRGTFETSALKSPDIFQIQGSSKALNTVNSGSLDAIRNAQIMNARAAQINSAASMRQGQLPSPVNLASSNPEAMDMTVKLRQLFISAVLGSASYLLCHDHGLIPLNGRTLTRPSRTSMKDAVASLSPECPRLSVPMITLDVALTPLGSLTLKATCQASSALSFVTISKEKEAVKARIHAGELVLLAPGAIMARYLGPCTEESVMNLGGPWRVGQNTSSQTARWQDHCRTWLVDMGIHSSFFENCAWLMVQISSSTFANQSNHKSRDTSYIGYEPLTFPWPAELCFVRHKVAHERSGNIKQTTAFGNNTMDRDPLIFAEQWHSSKVERDSNISKRQQYRDAEKAARAHAEMQAKVVASSTFSPVTARRNSTTVGVYPTPPDGVQVMTGVTPNFDGTSSTPGNLNQTTPMNIDSAILAKDDSSTGIWSSTNPRKESQGSEFPTNDEGDLFGEIGNDLFGEQDITDADFNFFDEPDKMQDVSMDNAGDSVDDEAKQLPAIDQHQEDDSGTTAMVSTRETSPAKMTDTNIPQTFPLRLTQTIFPSRGLQTDDSQVKGRLQQVLELDEKHEIAATLSPELVFRRLFPDPGQTVAKVDQDSSKIVQHRRFSQFGAIGFESAISAVNDKYSSNGRFGYVEKSKPALQPSTTTIPETEYLHIHHKRRKQAPSMSILTSLPSSTMPKIEMSGSAVTSVGSNDDIDLISGTGSDLSDPDDLSPVSEEFPLGFIRGVKRKREIHDEGDSEIASPFQNPLENTASGGIAEPIPIALDSDPADWPLNDFLSLPQPPMTSGLNLSDNEFMAAAQILTDQVASSTLPISSLIKGDASPLSADFLDEKTIVNKAQKDLATVARRCFQNVEHCNLVKFLSIQGLSSINQIMRTPARPQLRDGSVQLNSDNPFPLKTPYLEVRRSDSKLTVLPSAIYFWENLGLGPCKGNKDIRTVCIFPDTEGMADNAAIFLERMRGAYESGKLGSHDKITCDELGLEQGLHSGLMPMSLPLRKDQILDQQTVLHAIKTTCRQLGKALASISGEEKNLVVYFIYPSDDEEILPLVCSGFYDLYETYKRALIETRAKSQNELALQLIPKRFVASSTAIVIPSPADYARLAVEVYDRCTDFQSSSCSPSILLEQPLPERIDFKLTTTPSVSLLDENSCIHVAYAQSIDDRWISVAWTDNRGAEQMTASYCLGRKNAPISRSFSEIANEIWETTLDIISHKAVNWRIMLAKCGVMERSEIDFWATLAATESSASVTLTLLSIKSRPSLQLLPPPIPLSPTTLSTQSGMLTTPISTPQALSILSPDHTTTTPSSHNPHAPNPNNANNANNAPTPDSTSTPTDPLPPDATLTDITDQTWGSILSHRLNNSSSLLENNPTLLSGYLIKRGGTRPESIPTLLEINIVGVSSEGQGQGQQHRNARAYEHLLKEVMGMYRGLGTLVRVRGVVGRVGDARPWHVAAVEKAVGVLYSLM